MNLLNPPTEVAACPIINAANNPNGYYFLGTITTIVRSLRIGINTECTPYRTPYKAADVDFEHQGTYISHPVFSGVLLSFATCMRSVSTDLD